MEKLITLSDRFSTGEPTVIVIGQWGANKLFFEKCGSEDPYNFLKNITPDPDYNYVLVNALGAYEFYDDNKNGDGFPLSPYNVGKKATCGHAECEKHLDGWVSEPETLGHHYKTFEEHGGIYRHHQNKDKEKSLGQIVHSFLNDKMKRVELLLKINRRKDPDLTGKLDANEYLAVSMGCHVKWDVCTICGHRAPTRAQYCSHARNALRQIDPKTGKKNSVLNPSPKFFDISFVLRPADPTGFMLKKVAEAYEIRSSAELGEKIAENKAKLADVKKVSDIKKVIEGGTVMTTGKDLDIVKKYIKGKLVNNSKHLTDSSVKKLANFSLAEIIQINPTLSNKDIAKIHHYKVAKCMPSKKYLQKVAELTPIVFELAAKYASIENIIGYMLKTSDITDVLKNKILSHTEYEQPNTDLLTFTNDEGENFGTQLGVAHQQDFQNTKNNLLGSLLLTGGSYALMNKGGLPKWMSIPASLFLGSKFPKSQSLMSNEGYSVPSNTPTIKLNEYLDKIATDINDYNLLVKKPSVNGYSIIKNAEALEKISLTETGLVELDAEKGLGALMRGLE